MSRIYKTPFAATGDREALADTDPGTGKVSLPTGWTADYEKEDTDPNYRPVGRKEMNGALYEVTEGLGEMQMYGFAAWQALPGGWPATAIVRHGGDLYMSMTAANTTTPGAPGAAWKKNVFGGVPGATFAEINVLTEDQGPIICTDHGGATYIWDGSKYAPLIASETYAGAMKIATAALAQGFADDTTVLTPKKLADAFGGGNLVQGAGYTIMKFPNGVKFMCGKVGFPLVSGDISKSITFPQAFGSAVFNAGWSVNYGPASEVIGTYVNNITVTGMDLVCDRNNSDGITVDALWHAWGI